MPQTICADIEKPFAPELNGYLSIGLEETEKVKLMNRADSKFLLDNKMLNHILPHLVKEYRLLVIEGQRTGQYTSVYYDTPELTMFYKHLAGHFPRYKIRSRHYSQNDLHFLEVKRKTGNGRTAKKRIHLPKLQRELSLHSDWIKSQTPFSPEFLKPTLITRFNRFTLVNRSFTERVTIDYNLAFTNRIANKHFACANLVIIEIKQNKQGNSPLQELLKSLSIRRNGLSKYCMGHLLLNPNQPYKRYKSSMLKINSIQNGTTGKPHTI